MFPRHVFISPENVSWKENEICSWSKTNTCIYIYIYIENIHVQNLRAMKPIIDTSPKHKLQNLGLKKNETVV